MAHYCYAVWSSPSLAGTIDAIHFVFGKITKAAGSLFSNSHGFLQVPISKCPTACRNKVRARGIGCVIHPIHTVIISADQHTDHGHHRCLPASHHHGSPLYGIQSSRYVSLSTPQAETHLPRASQSEATSGGINSARLSRLNLLRPHPTPCLTSRIGLVNIFYFFLLNVFHVRYVTL